jgi:SAM-dependent methyltransferase
MLTIANVEQAAAWDGEEGHHWTEHADRYDAATRRSWERFLEAGLISANHSVLDIGCGTGRTTRDAARLASSGSVIGVDLSARMLERARERSKADGLTNVEYLQADAQVHPFDADAFDLGISGWGTMFFGDPVAAFTNLASAIRPHGRLAMLVWRELDRNEWLMAFRTALAAGRTLPVPPSDAPTPFAQADPERVRRVLGEAGFSDVGFTSIDEPVDFGKDADDAFGFVRKTGIAVGLTQDLDKTAKARAFDELRATIEAHATGEGVLFGTSSWLITATRD